MVTIRNETIKTVSGTGKSFGTFGELLQGVRIDGCDFLVTLPITRYSTAMFVVDEYMDFLSVTPWNKQKSRRLAEYILEAYQLPCKGFLTLESDIPIGKGLASSSADLVATARAISNCYNLDLSVEKLQEFMRWIEPTDGVMYEGVVSFYHREVRLCEFIGQLPPLSIIGKDEGGEIDTLEFNKSPKSFTLEEKIEYERLLSEISRAIREHDLHSIGKISTRSAMLNQKLHSKKHFEPMLDISCRTGALGIVVAHSGTYIGLLFDSRSLYFQEQKEQALTFMQNIPGEVTIYETWNDVMKG